MVLDVFENVIKKDVTDVFLSIFQILGPKFKTLHPATIVFLGTLQKFSE